MTHFHIMRDHKPSQAPVDITPKSRYASTTPCGCGCGEMIPTFDDHGRERSFVNGHSGRVRETNWSKTMVNALVTMWGKYPTKEIAAFIGISRNAVIGRAGRMGLPSLARGSNGIRTRTQTRLTEEERLRRERVRDEKRRQRKADTAKRVLRIAADNTASNVSKISQVRKVARPMVDIGESRNLLVGELTRDLCGFVTSTEPAPTHSGSLHRFCGCPVEPGKLFCQGHNYIAHSKSTVEMKEIAA